MKMVTIQKKRGKYLITEVCDCMNENISSIQTTLYIVSTPIGNLGDISYRAIETLEMVEKIYAEDTRLSRKLLHHYDIKTPLYSFHKYNEKGRLFNIIEDLKEGKSVALISDAGTPLISDPGENLIHELIQLGFNVRHIPGPTAYISGLILSGLQTSPNLFYGFLPAKKVAREKTLSNLKDLPYTLIFYEAPHRIQDTIASLKKVLKNRNVSLLRELTKKFETHYHFNLQDTIDFSDFKGEIVLVVEGKKTQPNFHKDDLIEHVKLNIADGLSEMEAIKKVAKLRNMKKNDVYMAFTDYKSTKGE